MSMDELTCDSPSILTPEKLTNAIQERMIFSPELVAPSVDTPPYNSPTSIIECHAFSVDRILSPEFAFQSPKINFEVIEVESDSDATCLPDDFHLDNISPEPLENNVNPQSEAPLNGQTEKEKQTTPFNQIRPLFDDNISSQSQNSLTASRKETNQILEKNNSQELLTPGDDFPNDLTALPEDSAFKIIDKKLDYIKNETVFPKKTININNLNKWKATLEKILSSLFTINDIQLQEKSQLTQSQEELIPCRGSRLTTRSRKLQRLIERTDNLLSNVNKLTEKCLKPSVKSKKQKKSTEVANKNDAKPNILNISHCSTRSLEEQIQYCIDSLDVDGICSDTETMHSPQNKQRPSPFQYDKSPPTISFQPDGSILDNSGERFSSINEWLQRRPSSQGSFKAQLSGTMQDMDVGNQMRRHSSLGSVKAQLSGSTQDLDVGKRLRRHSSQGSVKAPLSGSMQNMDVGKSLESNIEKKTLFDLMHFDKALTLSTQMKQTRVRIVNEEDILPSGDYLPSNFWSVPFSEVEFDPAFVDGIDNW